MTVCVSYINRTAKVNLCLISTDVTVLISAKLAVATVFIDDSREPECCEFIYAAELAPLFVLELAVCFVHCTTIIHFL